MNENCPKCGIDITQSSGVVCPECGFVIQPDADSAPLLREQKARRRGLEFVYTFLIPASVIALFVVISGGPSNSAALAGVVGGGVFFLAWSMARSMAGRFSQAPAGQMIAGICFFFGGIAVVVGLLFGGCMFAFR